MEKIENYAKLSMLPDVGAISALRLLRKFGSCDNIFSATAEQIAEVERIGERIARKIVENRDSIDPYPALARLKKLGGRYIPFESPEYPKMLSKISDKPIALSVLGNGVLGLPCVAIVGSRKCTRYGLDTARAFAATFARAGITVVSGMARGIDTAAHTGALDAGGSTIAVLGCGVDVIYPAENASLYNRIIETNGCAVISEFQMGARADRQTFPMRNRIISGLSLATVVIESGVHGGSMITARLADEQGRDVYAVPGRIDSAESEGCHALIRDGVRLVRSAEDIIDELKFSNRLKISTQVTLDLGLVEVLESQTDISDEKNKSTSKTTPPKSSKKNCNDTPTIVLKGDEGKIFSLFQKGVSLAADQIAARASLPISRCLSVLLMLEIRKILVKSGGGFWSIR